MLLRTSDIRDLGRMMRSFMPLSPSDRQSSTTIFVRPAPDSSLPVGPSSSGSIADITVANDSPFRSIKDLGDSSPTTGCGNIKPSENLPQTCDLSKKTFEVSKSIADTRLLLEELHGHCATAASQVDIDEDEDGGADIDTASTAFRQGLVEDGGIGCLDWLEKETEFLPSTGDEYGDLALSASHDAILITEHDPNLNYVWPHVEDI
ncbi:unnamed protein product [Protopolystoma xenopodis]|uniref:Uncharacterized protein n=1 Tax=Protopolystoma xenopodis TaxID=117903 RepID=A0A3S5FFN6_9PLAT|nr:unnamed protein product [Protopolystoma xenopodis]